MRWDEIEGDIWTIQGARTKNKRTHVVPLNDLTKSIVEIQRGVDQAFVFPSPRCDASAVTNFGKAVLFIREKSGVHDFRAHDLRRTVATELARLGASQSLIGRILNHVPEGVTARHYDRYEYLDEKRAILQRWAKCLSEIVSQPHL
jgi:integrase